MFSKKQEFWHDDLCLDLTNGDPSTKVQLYNCHKLGGNQKWEHERVGELDIRRRPSIYCRVPWQDSLSRLTFVHVEDAKQRPKIREDEK